MTPLFTGQTQPYRVEITAGDDITPEQVTDFLLFHARAMEKSGRNLKPLSFDAIAASDYLVQVKDHAGKTVAQCRLLEHSLTNPMSKIYPVAEDGLMLCSLSGLKHFPLMMAEIAKLDFSEIVLKTRYDNTACMSVSEQCGFTPAAPQQLVGDDYPSVFYTKELPKYGQNAAPSGSVNQSPVSLREAVYGPAIR